VRTRKSEARSKTPRAVIVKQKLDLSSGAGPEEIDEAELLAQDGDSVPQPLDDWSDSDDTNRWLDEHRCGEDDQFNIN
jgi:hypothetical protein